MKSCPLPDSVGHMPYALHSVCIATRVPQALPALLSYYQGFTGLQVHTKYVYPTPTVLPAACAGEAREGIPSFGFCVTLSVKTVTGL